MNATALILDGHLASALSAARDLHARGIRVIVGAPRRTAMTLHSNAASHGFVYPDPKKDRKAYLEMVQQIVQEERAMSGQKLVPYFFSDETFLPFARASSEARAAFFWNFPQPDLIETVFDKARTLAAAKDAELPIPREVNLSEASIKYPLILKPRHSCIWPEQGDAIRATASRVYSLEEAQIDLADIQNQTGEVPLIQACITGHEVGLFTVCQDGQADGWFAHRRLLGIHPNGGASSIRETLDPPVELREWSARLLEAVHWSGPAMVEWKYDEVAKTYRLMEINGRWWGSLPLTLASGYPAVWLWYQSSTNQRENKEPISTRRQVRAIHSLAVVKCILTCLKLGRFHQALYAIRLCLPSKKAFLKEDVFQWRDPAPGLWEIFDIIART